ncbi:MAG: T9SS type A sorting domain-containing protein [Melioribacteraceae bacterium]
MKGRLLFIFVLCTTIVFAQTKPLYFTYPTNGTVISIPEGQSTVNVTIQYSYTGTLATNEMHKLEANQTYESTTYPYNLVQSPPITCSLSAGTYTWKLERYLWEFGLGYQLWESRDEITFYVRPSITVRTSFGAGQLLVNSAPRDNGYNFTPEPNSTTYLYVEDQTSGDYLRVFRQWSGVGGTSTTRNNYINAPSTSSATATATMPKQCNITLSNPGHTISLNGNTYSSSVTTNVIEDNSISPTAEWYFVTNGIEYVFLDQWKRDSGQIVSPITATQHETFTPNYRIQALAPGVTFGTTIGQPLVINWTDNPNSNVTQYRIHRRVYQNGVWSADVVIATVNSGVQSYTDYEYLLGVWKQDILLEYGITAYYSVNSTWSQGGANTRVYCTIGASMQNNDLAMAKTESEVPVEFAISNYPNPFNPTTTINYQLPKDEMVTIKVYDVLGKEVATLVNEQKSAGYYKVDFDASKLTSGVYIAAIQSNSFSKSIKLLLTK